LFGEQNLGVGRMFTLYISFRASSSVSESTSPSDMYNLLVTNLLAANNHGTTFSLARNPDSFTVYYSCN